MKISSIIAAAFVSVVIIAGMVLAFHKVNEIKSNAIITSNVLPITATTATTQLKVQYILDGLNPNISPVLGGRYSDKIILVVFDPACPYCAIEYNSTLPLLENISNQAGIYFIPLPIHPDSPYMVGILSAVYSKYGIHAFLKLLQMDYSYYYKNILLYQEGKTSSLIAPNATTLLEMARELGYNVSNESIETYGNISIREIRILLSGGIYAAPSIYGIVNGTVVFQYVGVVPYKELVYLLETKMGIKIPQNLS